MHSVTYNIRQMIVNVYGAQAPAYSLSSAKRDMPLPRQALLNPGPGTYTTSDKLDRHQSLISLSQSKRFDLKPSPIPGPGEYETLSEFDRLVRNRDSLRSRTHSGEPNYASKYPPIKNSNPGPGSYDAHNIFKTPSLA